MFNKKSSLKPQLLRIIIVIYIITSIAAFSLIYFTLNNRIEDLGTRFSVQYLSKERNRITHPIQREIALAQKMVDTPILKQWAQNEDDPQLQEMALAELESYRSYFQDKSYFFIIDRSRNYYFNNRENEYENNQYRYTLDKNHEDDQWYFATMEEVDDYTLNVNVDRELNTTKLWINSIMHNKTGDKIGMGGTGLTLDNFLENFLKSNSPYITPILFDENGLIQAYEDTDYIQLSAISTDLSQARDKTIFELLDLKNEEQLSSLLQEAKQEDQQIKTLKLKLEQGDRIAALSYLPSLNWYTMILLDSSQLFSIWDFSSTIAILIISLLAIVLAIIYFINKIIINPVNRLTDFTEVIAAGNYDQRLNLDLNNELGRLATSFNNMASTINKHTDHLEELVSQRTAELSQTNQELKQKNKKIMDNITYARYIQQAILPAEEIFSQYFTDHFIIWQPRDKVGGDFYWLKEIDNHLLVAVVDCTGHGVPGALMTMSANAILNRIVDTGHTKNPASLLQQLNKMLKETLHKNNNDPKKDDGLDIGLCSLNLDTGKLVFAGAKMSLYYTEDEEIIRIKGDRHSIGYQRSRTDYEFTNHQLSAENRSFYMTTDGFLDQHGGEDNKRFCRRNFVTMLQANQEQSLKQQRDIYKERLQQFMGDNEQRDDITLLGFRL